MTHVRRIRGVKDIGADVGKSGEAADRVVEVGTTMEIIVRATRKYDLSFGYLGCGSDAGHGLIEIADGFAGVPRGVFDANAGKAGIDRRLHGGGHIIGCVAVAVLEITVDGQSCDPGQ